MKTCDRHREETTAEEPTETINPLENQPGRKGIITVATVQIGQIVETQFLGNAVFKDGQPKAFKSNVETVLK